MAVETGAPHQGVLGMPVLTVSSGVAPVVVSTRLEACVPNRTVWLSTGVTPLNPTTLKLAVDSAAGVPPRVNLPVPGAKEAVRPLKVTVGLTGVCVEHSRKEAVMTSTTGSFTVQAVGGALAEEYAVTSWLPVRPHS